MANNTTEEKTLTVSLESGGQQPGMPTVSYNVTPQPPYGNYPLPQGNSAPPQHGPAIPSQINNNPLGNYGIPQPGNPNPPQTNNNPLGNYGPPPVNPVITGQPQGNYGPLQPSGFGTPGGYNTNGAHQGNFGQPTIHPDPRGMPMIPGGPSRGNWMMPPQNVTNSPPGLEYLTTIDTLIVNQIFNINEAAPNQRDPDNQFLVTNSIGQNIYFAREEADDCSRQFCGSKRAFRMKIFDNFGNQVMQLNRPIACQACCFPCCMQKMEISAPPGTVVGLIEQEWSLLYPVFVIKTPSGDQVLKIKGPMCTMNCYADVEFKVLTTDGANEVGKISKKWSGYASENSCKMDVFGISFPMDLDVRMKAVMLGACFLIDMMYFEQSVVHPKAENQATHSAPQHQEIKPL